MGAVVSPAIARLALRFFSRIPCFFGVISLLRGFLLLRRQMHLHTRRWGAANNATSAVSASGWPYLSLAQGYAELLLVVLGCRLGPSLDLHLRAFGAFRFSFERQLKGPPAEVVVVHAPDVHRGDQDARIAGGAVDAARARTGSATGARRMMLTRSRIAFMKVEVGWMVAMTSPCVMAARSSGSEADGLVDLVRRLGRSVHPQAGERSRGEGRTYSSGSVWHTASHLAFPLA